ncbi:N-acetylmuramoyl-L-alanine amidase [Paenibacillus sophorae]|uniref:N-acetylmuramoyl-L-alanine amidase n=1 Tax=Paenibacillus sophorae TaxID=1333845 RepID=A0A1H8S963_9BACL|nr:N-acetylmuramoyl-L-alanine amidase family protein [Paenibacillus sophorae]QWU16808.1 N-acetylmuramoyl-L-alanine amidase family protein [Paenibacillus sophorae]SEO75589.1 N-acetylmuramoyl-L-alanine amidase [Paenibacillus sophorae]
MKKLVMALACITFLFLFASVSVGQANADAAIRLYLDNKLLQPEVPPRLVGNTTMVPLRIVSEELGAKVSWSQADKQITVKKDELVLRLYINNTKAFVNGDSYLLETAPLLVKGNTLIPVRFVSENLGLEVIWDNSNRSVSLINTGEVAVSGSLPDKASSLVHAGSAPTPGLSSSAAASASPGSPKPTPSPNTGNFSSQPSETIKPGTSFSPSPSPANDGITGNLPVVNRIERSEDGLKIAAEGGSIKPGISNLSDPERLVIDVPGATLGQMMNGENMVQNGEIPVKDSYINKIRYNLFQGNPSGVRIIVDLKQKVQYNLLESQELGEWTLQLSPTDTDTKQYRVVLDAGHGGTDPGNTSVGGRFEKEFNLAIVLKLAKVLEEDSNISVFLTRQDDTAVKRADRSTFANNLKADIFISIHGNSYTKQSASGTETYYTRDDSKELADVLHRYIVPATGFIDRNVRKSNFQVTRETVMPAVLCEIGFMSNPQEERTMWDKQFQLRVSEAIASGIKEYLQVP